MATADSPQGRHYSDDVLVANLLAGRAVKDAAAQSGVSERTAHRRLRNPSFRRRLADARADRVCQAADALTASSLQAIKTLESIHQSAEAPFKDRVAAAAKIIDALVRLREAADQEQRL